MDNSMRETDRLLKQLESDPDNIDLLFDLAYAYGKEKSRTEAIHVMVRLLKQTLPLDEWGNAKRWLGFLHYRENDLSAAIEIANELLDANIDAYNNGHAHHLMARCLLEKSLYAKETTLSEQYRVEAVQHLEQAASLLETEGEERAEILVLWGTELRLQGRLDKANDVLNSALRMLPDGSRTAGMCHEQLGLIAYDGPQDYENAVLHLEKAIKILLGTDPDYLLTWAYGNLSQAYVWLEEYDKALLNAQRSLETAGYGDKDRKAQFVNAHQVCGDAYYYSERDLAQAQKHYKAYLKLLDKEETARQGFTLMKLADIDRLTGKYRRALKGFRKALAFDPPGTDYGALYAAMGECASKSGQFDEAVKAYTAAIENSGDDKEVLADRNLSLGHGLFELKRYREAAEAYREGLRYVDPKAPEREELMTYLVAANELMSH